MGATPLSGTPTVTVCANDFGLANLGQNLLPIPIRQARADPEALVREVVELQDHRIGLAAIDAWMLAKETDEEDLALTSDPILAGASLVDVPLPIGCVVRPSVSSPARSAERVTLALVPTPPSERGDLLLLPAASTRPHVGEHG